MTAFDSNWWSRTKDIYLNNFKVWFVYFLPSENTPLKFKAFRGLLGEISVVKLDFLLELCSIAIVSISLKLVFRLNDCYGFFEESLKSLNFWLLMLACDNGFWSTVFEKGDNFESWFVESIALVLGDFKVVAKLAVLILILSRSVKASFLRSDYGLGASFVPT